MVSNHISLPTAQIQCSKCKTTHRAGTIFCDKCGAALLSLSMPYVGSTQVMDGVKSSIAEINEVLGMDRGNEFRQGMTLQLTAMDNNASITITPKYGRSIMMGRSDPIQKHRPEMDLTEIGGYSKGISRSHASLVLINHRLQLMDMNSSNGTFLNDKLIPPRKPVELRHGDLVRLGKLEMRVSFLN